MNFTFVPNFLTRICLLPTYVMIYFSLSLSVVSVGILFYMYYSLMLDNTRTEHKITREPGNRNSGVGRIDDSQQCGSRH